MVASFITNRDWTKRALARTPRKRGDTAPERRAFLKRTMAFARRRDPGERQTTHPTATERAGAPRSDLRPPTSNLRPWPRRPSWTGDTAGRPRPASRDPARATPPATGRAGPEALALTATLGASLALQRPRRAASCCSGPTTLCCLACFQRGGARSDSHAVFCRLEPPAHPVAPG